MQYLNIFIFVCLITFCHAQTIINYEAAAGTLIENQEAINTPNLESSPAFVGDKIGYIYTGSQNKFVDALINEPFFDIGLTEVDVDNRLSDRKTFYKRINSDLHEGAMSHDLHTNRLYFTRSFTEKALVGKVDTTYLRIMSADLNQSNPKIETIDINVDRYSVCHPSLSSDGESMIFSSNRPGGNGKMDLYVAYYDGKKWTGITNLTKSINTTSNEIFPYLLNDTMLVFASDRVKGFGGLDMYVSTLKDGEWSPALILPKPFNSGFDDFGLISRPDMMSGYMTSTRLGGRGKDDIYKWSAPMPIFGATKDAILPIVIHVLDKLSLQPIPGVKAKIAPLDININDFTLSSFNVDMLNGQSGSDIILKIKPKDDRPSAYFVGNISGDININTWKRQKYYIQLEADDYKPTAMVYDFRIFSDNFNMVMESTNIETEDINPEDTISVFPTKNFNLKEPSNEAMNTELNITSDSVYRLQNLYFEYNSHTLQNGATLELDALVKFMSYTPETNITIESHTDSRGTEAYNLHLSILRAEAARDYLVDRGIGEDRIEIRGYGESKLLNECTDRIPCSEAKHRKNRRIEVRIK